MQRFTVVRAGPLLTFLLVTLPLKRKAVKDLLKFGAVAVNGGTIRQFDHPLAVGDEVTVSEARTVAAAGALETAKIQLVHEDDALLVVDKPSGLLTVASDRHKTDTLFVRLNSSLRARGAGRAFVVHRLDQDTSGLVLFARSEAIKRELQDDWPNVRKTYWAVVAGHPPAAQGAITSYLTETRSLHVISRQEPAADARQATTRYRLLHTAGELSLLEVRLETGRKHQIRVHLADLGCPVIGDRRYGAGLDVCGRLGLHACGLRFTHPVTGEGLAFTAPLPAELAKLFPRNAM